VQSAIAQQRQLSEVQIPMAQQTLREAQANEAAALQVLERSRTLFRRDLLSQAALDEAIRAEQVTRSKVSSLSAQLKSLQQNGSQQALADTALHQAQAGLALAQARLAYTQLTAPVAGVLISRNVEPGDVVQPGKTLMQLSPATQTQLVVQIEEKNLHLIQLQQPALASADAYAQARFNAELVYINPGVDAQRGSVEVKLLVAEPPDYLRQDMTVSVDIEVARRSNAVLVASDAIHGADQQIPWVFKLEGRQVRKTNVKLGLRSQGWTEVLEGLKAGDQVIPISPIPISDGLNIRVLPSIAQAKS
jgi:HlyD family secretion protein